MGEGLSRERPIGSCWVTERRTKMCSSQPKVGGWEVRLFVVIVFTAFSLMERTGKLEIQEGGLLPSTIVLWKPLMGLLCWGRAGQCLCFRHSGSLSEFPPRKDSAPIQHTTFCSVGGCARGETETTLNSPSFFSSSRQIWTFLFHLQLDHRPRPKAPEDLSLPLDFHMQLLLESCHFFTPRL